MKKFVLAIFCLLSTTLSDATIFSKNGCSFELTGGLGIKHSEIREHVFETAKTNGEQWSRLDWQPGYMPYVSIGGLFNLKGFVFNMDFAFGIPQKQGIVEDWDWLLLDGIPTNYSKSDLKNEKYIDLNFKAGYKFRLQRFSITPQIGFMFRNTKYSGIDGYQQYASQHKDQATDGKYWNKNITKTALNGTILSYEQKTYMPYLNLELQLRATRDWVFVAFGSYSPYIYLEAYDNHPERKIYYLDELKGGYSYTIGGEIRWKIISLGADFEYLEIKDGITGKKWSGNNWKNYEKTDDSSPGTDWKSWSFYLRVRL